MSSRSNTNCLTQLRTLEESDNLTQQKHVVAMGCEKDVSLLNTPIHFLFLHFLVFLHPDETTPTMRSFSQFSSCRYADWGSKSSKLHGNRLRLPTMPDTWQAPDI